MRYFRALTYASILCGYCSPTLAVNITEQECRGQAATTSTPYPNKCHIAQVFAPLAQSNFSAFFKHVSPTVNWTLMGTHALAGQYNNLTIFATDTILRLSNTIDETKPSSFDVLRIIGGGNEAWSSQELHALATCKNGAYICSERSRHDSDHR